MNKQGKRSKKISRESVLKAIEQSMKDQRALLAGAKKVTSR